MRMIVHAGLPKTGSSALQEYLAQARDALESLGITYPDFGHRSHWLLAAALSEDPASYHQSIRRLPQDEIAAQTSAALNQLSDIVRQAGPDDVIILSHESFAVESRLARLKAYLKEVLPAGSSTTLLAYARNPVEHYSSGLQNALRSKTGKFRNPSQWVSSHPERGLALKKIFEADAFVRLYSRKFLIDGDVISDFREFVGSITGLTMPSYEAGGISSNSSLSAAGCALLYILRAHPSPPDMATVATLRKRLPRFDRAEARAKMSIPAEWLPAITMSNRHEWNTLVPTMDVGAETRQAALLPLLDVPKPVSNADVHAFLLGCIDQAYLSAYAQAVQAPDQGGGKAASSAVAWLEGPAVSAIRDGFTPIQTLFARRKGMKNEA